MSDMTHYDATVTGAAARLSDLLGFTSNDPRNVPFQSLSLQADGGNTGVVYVGGPTVSTSSWLNRVPIPVTSIPAAPLIYEGFGRPVKLSEIFVIGSVPGDKLHVGGFPW